MLKFLRKKFTYNTIVLGTGKQPGSARSSDVNSLHNASSWSDSRRPHPLHGIVCYCGRISIVKNIYFMSYPKQYLLNEFFDPCTYPMLLLVLPKINVQSFMLIG